MVLVEVAYPRMPTPDPPNPMEALGNSADRFLATMPPEYRRRHDRRAAQDHALIAERRRGAAKLGTFRCTTARAGVPVCVVADDRPGLLATIGTALVSCGLEVSSGEAYVRRREDGRVEAIDLVWVRRAQGNAVWISEEELAQLQGVLVGLLSGQLDRDILVRYAREHVTPDLSSLRLSWVHDGSYLSALDVETRDRPGLMLALSAALYSVDLQIINSEIRTLAARAIDRFYVTELDGTRVPFSKMNRIERAIHSTLERGAMSNPTTLDVIYPDQS